MIAVDKSLLGLFGTPQVFFTLKDQLQSRKVMELLQDRVGNEVACHVCHTPDEVHELFVGGRGSDEAVVLFDSAHVRGHFTPTSRSRQGSVFPDWAGPAFWGVAIHPTRENVVTRCANQVASDFVAKFTTNIERTYSDKSGGTRGCFPWGPARAGEKVPARVTLPEGMPELVARLNEGPDLARNVAESTHALELPEGSKISWVRVAPVPLKGETDKLEKAHNAFRAFEAICTELLQEDQAVADLMMSGVQVAPYLRHCYLQPNVSGFSVRRPDLHVAHHGVFASESDEMPGGLAECFHLDRAYDVNQKRWQQCFEWLCAEGPLYFVISHDWSSVYVEEMNWLVRQMQDLGYPARLLRTDELDSVSIKSDGVWVGEERIGTIWRQFPIFEAKGQLADVVLAAHAGKVRMVPEFAHFGNKTWFSLFRSHERFFADRLSHEVMRELDILLPHSHLVRSRSDFPCQVGGATINSIVELQHLPQAMRDRLVLKITGANDRSSRSYGVLMGVGIPQGDWIDWIEARMRDGQPFLVQTRVECSTVRMPVLHTKVGAGQSFDSRVLLRPWEIGGNLVTVSACAVPNHLYKVHGMVDMCMAPVVLDS